MTASSKQVMIVEDEESLRKALVKKFTSEGFRTLEANDGKKGLEIALVQHPDIILLDIIMPEMDGMSFLREIRLDAWGKKVPIILLTNLYDAENIAAAHQKKVFDYLIKSDWQLGDIVKKVKDKLDLK
ncbi:MAG: response regulator [bacterium]|nr:response regulator [bacterium]